MTTEDKAHLILAASALDKFSKVTQRACAKLIEDAENMAEIAYLANMTEHIAVVGIHVDYLKLYFTNILEATDKEELVEAKKLAMKIQEENFDCCKESAEEVMSMAEVLTTEVEEMLKNLAENQRKAHEKSDPKEGDTN